MDKDVSNRLAKAGASFGRLWTRVWGEQGITLGTKWQVHKAVPVLWLWNLLAAIQKKLDQFHLRYLRKVMRISREDRVSNTELLLRANIPCIEALIMKPKLRGVGHVVRTDDARFPKMVFFSDLATGARSIGHSLKRFKDGLDEKPSLQTPAPGELPSTRAFKAFQKAAVQPRPGLSDGRVLVARRLRLSDWIDLNGFFELFRVGHYNWFFL